MKLKIILASLLFIVGALTAQPLNNSALTKANSVYDELNPVVSPDGKVLYLTIANHPQNMGGKKDPGDIWISKLEGNSWSEPIHAGAEINDRGFNGIAGFSFDGNDMFLLNHYDPQGGTPRTQGISVSHKSGEQWTRPENISIPYFQNRGGVLSGYITPDKNLFIFSAETYGSYGVEDLYITQRNSSGKWSEPKNLGAKINTQFQELSPALSSDGKTLFFSSNGRKGLGSFDVYSSTRLDDSWQNWSDPVNLGPEVNTEGRDLYYRPYPTGFALYTSTKDSDGYGDIRMRTIDEFLPENQLATTEPIPDNGAQFSEPETEPGKTNVLKIYGKVQNAKTGETVPAMVTFEPVESSVGTKKINSTADGYSVGVDTGSSFKVIIEASGFISSIEKLDVKTYEMKELEMNFNLQPIVVGATVSLEDVLFEQSRIVLLPQSYAQLDLVVSFMKANPNVSIELAGHTDNQGVASKNVELSQRRVNRVKEYLVSKGIEKNRITGKGYGGARPVASNDSEETRKLNRRVEFTIRKS